MNCAMIRRRATWVMCITGVVALVPATVVWASPSRPGKPNAAGTWERVDQRATLVNNIVQRWTRYVERWYDTDGRNWSMEMAPTFATATTEMLNKAASARSFRAMNDALLPPAVKADSPLEFQEKALGSTNRDLVFVPIAPCRIFDTRIVGGPIAAGETRNFDVTGVGNYTAQGGEASNCSGAGAAGSFAAAAINFTVVFPDGPGHIRAFSYLGTLPNASTVNYQGGDIRANTAIVQLYQGGSSPELSVYSQERTHLVGDMLGYFTAPAATNLSCYSTSVTAFTISANTSNFFNNPACPSGYTATTPYCWTATSGVYSQGSGFNANVFNNATFCAWQNTTLSSQTVFGGNVCCRVSGQ